MWCEPGPPPAVLPAVLAVPWAAVASAVGMPPVLTYATYNLLNWRRLDTEHDSPVELGNIVCLQVGYGLRYVRTKKRRISRLASAALSAI